MRLGFSFRVSSIKPLLAGCLLASLVGTLQSRAGTGTAGPADQSYARGVQALRQEQWRSAVSSFEEALKLEPNRADAENGLGVALGKLGDPQGSQAAFRRAIEVDPAYAEPHYNLALSRRSEEHTSELQSRRDL